MITPDQLKHIMPYSGNRAELFAVPLSDAMDEFCIDTPIRQAAFIAQVAHESGSLRYVRELASGQAYNGRADLGNTKPEAIRIAGMYGMSPGPFWKGHGLIQITGFDNHVACGKALGLDLANHPESLELPAFAARSAAWFWKTHDLNKWADDGDFNMLTRKINGGLNGLADRLAFFAAAQEVIS